MLLAETLASCHAPKLEHVSFWAKHALPAWLRDCQAECPEQVPCSVFDGPRVANERATTSGEVRWLEVEAHLRVIAETVSDRPKHDYPQLCFSAADSCRDSAVSFVHAIAFDFDNEPQAMNVPALFWAHGLATLSYESGSSRVVTEQNPLGLPRLRVVIPLATPISKEKFKSFAALLSRAIADATGLSIDCQASTNLFWFAGPRPSAEVPTRHVDWTPGLAWEPELVEAHLANVAPAEPLPAPAQPTPTRSKSSRYNPQEFFDGALLRARDAIANAPAGSRNRTLVREVHSLAQLINQGLSPDDITQVARAGCEANGLWREDPKACLRTIKSGLRAGQSEPRYPRSRLTYDVDAFRAQSLARAVSRGLKPRERAVVAEIAKVLDVVTGYAIITRETLAERTGLTVLAITKMVSRLEARGVLAVVRARIPNPGRPGSTRNAANQYRIV